MKENDLQPEKSTEKKKQLGYLCPICREPSNMKVHRNLLLKYILFFVPVRKFFCPGCNKPFYVNLRRSQRGIIVT